MNRARKYLVLALAGVLLLMSGVGAGCAKSPPAPPPDPIQFDVAPSAQLARVEWYIGDMNNLWVNVTVLNKSDKETGFLVSVKADSEPEIIAAAEAATKVKPGKTQVYKLMTSLSKPEPRQLSIRVALP